MSYKLTEAVKEVVKDECTDARSLCAPSFVYSVEGQVGFKSALEHLASCNKRPCQNLRVHILDSMQDKLSWLMNEECLLGCLHIQTQIYGSRKPRIKRVDFPAVATHLASCPQDSCAQLRRALLLTIRDSLRPH